MRISPNELAFTSATSVELIHGAKAGQVARGPFYGGDPNRPADSMLSTRSLSEHRWRRKGWEKGFGSYQLKQFEPRVKRHLETLVKQLTQRAGRPIDVTRWAEFFAYDVMSDLAFSDDFGMLVAGETHPYITALHSGTRVLVIAAQTPWIKPLMPYLMMADPTVAAHGKEFARISRKTYEQRKARTDGSADMFGYLVDNHSSKAGAPRPLTEDELIADTSRESILSEFEAHGGMKLSLIHI